MATFGPALVQVATEFIDLRGFAPGLRPFRKLIRTEKPADRLSLHMQLLANRSLGHTLAEEFNHLVVAL
jgi:hypothetical protein